MPSVKYRLMTVDPATWADDDVMQGEISASVKRDANTKLLESFAANVEGGIDEKPRETWARVEALIDGASREAIATMLLVPSKSTVRKGRRITAYDGYSVLKPCNDRFLLAGEYIPAGADGAAETVQLIAECTPAPVTAHGSFRLSEPIVFGSGTTYLDAAWMLVDKAGWCIQIGFDGTINVLPMPSESSLDLDKATSWMLGTSISSNDGMANVPNQYVATDGTNTAIVTDDDPNSPTSTVSRNGRIVQVFDSKPVRVGGESLEQYATRKLAESMTVIGTRGYRREWAEGVNLFDVVKGTLPEADLDCRMRVTRQSIGIPGELMVDEECAVLR